jgi:hypothetical protein
LIQQAGNRELSTSPSLVGSAGVNNLRRSPKRVIKFYNGRGTVEQWIKEGKQALKWMRL